MHHLWATLLCLCAIGAPSAFADGMDAGDEQPISAEVMEEPVAEESTETIAEPKTVTKPFAPHTASNGREAIDEWDDTRGLRYGTEYLFPFTRGMEDAGIRGWARYPAGVLTVPLDLALLPAGLVAGLWGG